MIVLLSKHITSFLVRQKIIQESDVEIYEYGIKHIIMNVFNFLIIALVATLFKTWAETFGFFLGFMPVRMIAGGYHAKTPIRCDVISLMIYSFNVFIVHNIYEYINDVMYMSFGIVIIIIIFVFAPVDHKNRRLDVEEFKKAKRQSRILVLVLTGCTIILKLILTSNNVILVGTQMGSLTSAISLIIGKIVRGGEKNEEINKGC